MKTVLGDAAPRAVVAGLDRGTPGQADWEFDDVPAFVEALNL